MIAERRSREVLWRVTARERESVCVCVCVCVTQCDAVRCKEEEGDLSLVYHGENGKVREEGQRSGRERERESEIEREKERERW